MCGRCATRDVSPWDGCWYEAQKEQPPRRPLPAAGRLHFPKGEKEERKNADDLDPPTAAPRAARTCKVRVVKKEPFPPRKDHFPAVPEEKWIIPGDSRVVKVARPREVAVPEEIAEQQFGAPEEQGAAKVDGDDAAQSVALVVLERVASAAVPLSPSEERNALVNTTAAAAAATKGEWRCGDVRCRATNGARRILCRLCEQWECTLCDGWRNAEANTRCARCGAGMPRATNTPPRSRDASAGVCLWDCERCAERNPGSILGGAPCVACHAPAPRRR